MRTKGQRFQAGTDRCDGLLTVSCSSRHSCVVGPSARLAVDRLNAVSRPRRRSRFNFHSLSSLAFSLLAQVRLEAD